MPTTMAEPMSMFVTYPEGHKHAGARVGRTQTCSCGQEFSQGKVNPEWLSNMWSRLRAKLLQSDGCQTDRDGTVWIPKQCPKCERLALRLPYTNGEPR